MVIPDGAASTELSSLSCELRFICVFDSSAVCLCVFVCVYMPKGVHMNE